MHNETEATLAPEPKILIVEDEGIIARDLSPRLKRLGFNVSGIADNAVDALRLVEATSPDLVLMDIIIQGNKDGVETAKDIRAHFDVPVVFVTAHSDTPTLERAKDATPFGYILKPFEMRELKTAIEMALFRHQIEKEQRLARRALYATAVGILITDPHQLDHPILCCNGAFERMSGYSKKEIVGQSLSFFQGPEVDPQAWNTLQEAIQAQRDCHLTIELAGRDTFPFRGDLTLSPILNDVGKLTHFVIVCMEK